MRIPEIKSQLTLAYGQVNILCKLLLKSVLYLILSCITNKFSDQKKGFKYTSDIMTHYS